MSRKFIKRQHGRRKTTVSFSHTCMIFGGSILLGRQWCYGCRCRYFLIRRLIRMDNCRLRFEWNGNRFVDCHRLNNRNFWFRSQNQSFRRVVFLHGSLAVQCQIQSKKEKKAVSSLCKTGNFIEQKYSRTILLRRLSRTSGWCWVRIKKVSPDVRKRVPHRTRAASFRKFINV